jgi:hypothetical protein
MKLKTFSKIKIKSSSLEAAVDIRRLTSANKTFRELRPKLREQALHFDAQFGTSYETEIKKHLSAVHQIIEDMEDKVLTPPEEEPTIFS